MGRGESGRVETTDHDRPSHSFERLECRRAGHEGPASQEQKSWRVHLEPQLGRVAACA